MKLKLITMLVAIFTVHLPNGWQAIADPSAAFANERVQAAAEKLELVPALTAWDMMTILMGFYLVISSVISVRRGLA